MKFLVLFLTIVFTAGSTFADSPKKGKTKGSESSPAHKESHQHGADHKPHKEKNTVESIKKLSTNHLLVKVNGMVCSFCAQGIEKNFKKRKEVKEVKVDLDNMLVHLTLNPGASLPETKVKNVVESAGFMFKEMKHE